MQALTFAPYELADGGADQWDRLADVWPEQLRGALGRWIGNLDLDNIIATVAYSPRDLEKSSSSFVRGDFHGAAPFFHQMNGHRPTPDLAQYKVPGVDGFYLVGPFMHPGAGRATAIRMMGDMGIDFGKVIGA